MDVFLCRTLPPENGQRPGKAMLLPTKISKSKVHRRDLRVQVLGWLGWNGGGRVQGGKWLRLNIRGGRISTVITNQDFQIQSTY